MESNELRLGNLLHEEDVGVILVESLNSFGGEEINEDSARGYIEPIPLTEEWLKRIEWDNSLFQITDFTVITFSFGALWINLGGNYKPRRIEFVHQLQNLYFALTGQELTIKEPAL